MTDATPSTTAPRKLLAISGSLRAASHNTAVARTLAELATPLGVEVELAAIGDIPLYNADLDKSPAVLALEAGIAGADGVVIVTPEYNYGIPGVLKNAIDWASRPAYESVFRGKPVAIAGATGSLVGTARAQAHLKTVLLGMLAEVFPWPEVLVSRASQRIVDGRVVDETTREMLDAMLQGFVAWIGRRAS